MEIHPEWQGLGRGRGFESPESSFGMSGEVPGVRFDASRLNFKCLIAARMSIEECMRILFATTLQVRLANVRYARRRKRVPVNRVAQSFQLDC